MNVCGKRHCDSSQGPFNDADTDSTELVASCKENKMKKKLTHFEHPSKTPRKAVQTCLGLS